MVKNPNQNKIALDKMLHNIESVTADDLKHLYTKQLLKFIHDYHRLGRYYYENIQELMSIELATREHVPNKREGKKARQEAAKRKH